MKFYFKKYAKFILVNRMKEVFDHFSKNNRKIVVLSKVLTALQGKIMKKLGKDQELFYDYEEASNHCNSLMLERAYLQGLIDGIRVSKFYKQVSKEDF